MNNEQFRRLILANSAKSDRDKDGASPSSPSRSAAGTSVALGSKLKPSIPMTPRSVAGGARVDFAKQLAERNQAFEQTQKKFRTAAPKGSKPAPGYVDRARTRQDEEDDERAQRLRALEEAFKKGEMDRDTFDRLRGEIVGGDLSSTYLVKGLDFKLLERVRRGEDVYSEILKPPGAGEQEQQREEPDEDPDAVLEQLESTEVKAITREKVQKKGQLATTALNPGQKRTRNQILAEWKAAREAARAKAESGLGSKFKKIGEKKTPGMRIERDSKGREVMIIVDEDGHERRKVRKIDPKASEEQEKEEKEKEKAALVSGEVLGMEVPEFYRKQQEEAAAREAEEDDKEINIFDDAGSDYDPLAGLEGSDGSSDEEEGESKEEPADGKAPAQSPPSQPSPPPPDAASEEMPPPPKPDSAVTRNYFKDSKTGLVSQEEYKAPSLDDPAFLAALRKAKAVSEREKSAEEREAAEREERLKKKLSELNRDDEDLDMGFGSSRLEDDADADESAVKLSAWDEDDDDDDDGVGGGKSKRKRGRKKKKGDKNNFEDVMKVIQRNRGGG